MTSYSVRIDFTAGTAEQVTAAGMQLYALKAVRCSFKTGLPLVWLVTSRLMPLTTVAWTSPYDGFVSASPVAAGAHIVPGFEAELPIGSTLRVTSPVGTGDVVTTGVPGACAIENATTTQFSCGLAQKPADTAMQPLCAFPLYGGNLAAITPLEQVLLMFSTASIAPGTAVTSLNPPAATRPNIVFAVSTGGVLVDLAGATERRIRYDINGGWDWGGATWGRAVPATANLRDVLIQPEVS